MQVVIVHGVDGEHAWPEVRAVLRFSDSACAQAAAETTNKECRWLEATLHDLTDAVDVCSVQHVGRKLRVWTCSGNCVELGDRA